MPRDPDYPDDGIPTPTEFGSGVSRRHRVPANRDVLRVKTPPAGIRAQTAKPVDATLDADGFPKTGNHMLPEERTYVRTARAVVHRINDLESGHRILATRIGELGDDVARGNGKLDGLRELAELAAAERERRADREADLMRHQLDTTANVQIAQVNVQPRMIQARGLAIAAVITAGLASVFEILHWILR